MDECSVKCDIQSLIVSPENAQVVEGQSTVLNCHVSNQVGTVQWSKDGLLLGFDPEIPGFPRYQIIGNTSLGFYDLNIDNVTLEDEADYECQIGPAEGQEAIIGKAHLTVLFEPTSVEIVDQDNGSEIQVKVPEHLSLQCEVKGGKPAPEINWYRNSYKLADDQSRESITDEDNKRQTTKSVLEISPNPDDNKAHYVCEGYTSFSSTRLKAFVILDVLYPPGMPVIEGYRTSEKIRSGESVRIKCSSSGGNPLARLVWTKNGEVIDHSYITSDWESINEISFTASASDDGATYVCSASSIMTSQPMEKALTLEVLYAPSSLSIKAPKEAKPNTVITATCKTERSNPAADVTWVIDGVPMLSENDVESHSKGGWVTTSKISVNITEQDRNSKHLTCYAVNQELGETITQSSTVSILYAPDPPSILGYEEGNAIHAGHLQRFVCISYGGNPLPDLKWYKGDEELTGPAQSTTGTIVSKELTIIAAADDNGAQYYCKSTSKALSEPLVKSITLIVYYPPSIPTIKVKPKKPKAGSQADLICECSNSNPAANVTWWSSSEKDEILEAASISIKVDEKGGYSTKATLVLNVTAENDGSKYICQATNEAIQQSAHDAIILSVLYKPVFVLSDNSVFEVKENESSVIDIAAKGNPDKITYIWMKDNETVWEGSVLNISSAERSHSGIYTCIAKNEIGESSLTVVLEVLYPMVIKKDMEESAEKIVIAEPNSNVRLYCNADGYPLPKDGISWKNSDVNMNDRTETITASGKSILVIKNVTEDISGPFICHADNGVGSADSWKIILLVKHDPLIKDLDTYDTVYSDRNTKVELQCKAGGVPDVTFTWSFQGVKVSEGNSRINNEVTRLDHFVWKSVLTIEDVNAQDFGEYKCIARNEIGFDTAELKLLPDSAPDPPILLKIINITRDSLFVAWVPGFDGGHNQSYRIRFKSVMNLAASYIDVHPPEVNSFWIRNLDPDTEYELAMMSTNSKGSSPYTTDRIKVKTLSKSDTSYKLNNGEVSFNGNLVGPLVGAIGTVFLLLFIFNVILLALYYQKKKPVTRKKYAEDEYSSSSDVSTSSKLESEETTFSSFSSEPKISEDRLSSYSTYSNYLESKSTVSESSAENSSDVSSEEYSSGTYNKGFSSSKFI